MGPQGANAQLHARVQELGSELQSAKEELAALDGLQQATPTPSQALLAKFAEDGFQGGNRFGD